MMSLSFIKIPQAWLISYDIDWDQLFCWRLLIFSVSKYCICQNIDICTVEIWANTSILAYVLSISQIILYQLNSPQKLSFDPCIFLISIGSNGNPVLFLTSNHTHWYYTILYCLGITPCIHTTYPITSWSCRGPYNLDNVIYLMNIYISPSI